VLRFGLRQACLFDLQRFQQGGNQKMIFIRFAYIATISQSGGIILASSRRIEVRHHPDVGRWQASSSSSRGCLAVWGKSVTEAWYQLSKIMGIPPKG
jgi:hypothetical protein